jgi:hypothetical protein
MLTFTYRIIIVSSLFLLIALLYGCTDWYENENENANENENDL